MVVVKVCKIGNSLGIVLPSEVIGRLGISEGHDVFLIEEPNNTYRIMSADPAFEKGMAKAGGIMARYRGTLRTLK